MSVPGLAGSSVVRAWAVATADAVTELRRQPGIGWVLILATLLTGLGAGLRGFDVGGEASRLTLHLGLGVREAVVSVFAVLAVVLGEERSRANGSAAVAWARNGSRVGLLAGRLTGVALVAGGFALVSGLGLAGVLGAQGETVPWSALGVTVVMLTLKAALVGAMAAAAHGLGQGVGFGCGAGLMLVGLGQVRSVVADEAGWVWVLSRAVPDLGVLDGMAVARAPAALPALVMYALGYGAAFLAVAVGAQHRER